MNSPTGEPMRTALLTLGRWTARTIVRTVAAFLVSAAIVSGTIGGCRIMRRPVTTPAPLPCPDFLPPAVPVQ